MFSQKKDYYAMDVLINWMGGEFFNNAYTYPMTTMYILNTLQFYMSIKLK